MAQLKFWIAEKDQGSVKENLIALRKGPLLESILGREDSTEFTRIARVRVFYAKTWELFEKALREKDELRAIDRHEIISGPFEWDGEQGKFVIKPKRRAESDGARTTKKKVRRISSRS